jgi:excisionase family DNA binding protein
VKEQQEYPLAIKVKDVAEIMGVCVEKAYAMTHRKDFPAIRDGNRIIIPRDAFFRWFNEAAVNAHQPTA